MTHGALAVCLATRYPLMWVLIVLMIIKEDTWDSGTYFPEKGKMLDGAMWFGRSVQQRFLRVC